MYLALVRLPGVSGIDHTEKKVSGIEIVDGKVNEQSVKCSQRYRKFKHGHSVSSVDFSPK
jgi:hypothetical protein